MKRQEQVSEKAKPGRVTETISEDVITAVQKKMRRLPEKKARRLTKIDVVTALRGDIESMRQKGYSLKDVAEYLSENGVKISVATLRNYFARTDQGAAGGVDSVSAGP